MKYHLRKLLSVLAVGTALTACGPSEPQVGGIEPSFRQLTEKQYRNTVARIFGEDVAMAGQFSTLNRVNGLVAVGASAAAMTPSVFEKFDRVGQQVASQVMAPNRRDVLVPCKPAKVDAADDACATKFFSQVGKLLYRRPLTETELSQLVGTAKGATGSLKDFYAGLEATLNGMLASPDFLYITERTEADPDAPGKVRLDAYSKASRLSFLLWNMPPDEELLEAAAKGDLHTQRGIERQADRMLESPLVEEGVRAFFIDMFDFEKFNTLAKDSIVYPAYGLATILDSQEQTLRTLVDHLLTRDGDYRDIFTTRKTYMTTSLALIYGVSVDEPYVWQPYEFPTSDPHAGIQSHVSFLSMHAHPGRSSATLRGKAIRELMMCQIVPDPPANVDFTLVSDGANPEHKTARERLAAHNAEPSCAGCHKLMDPIGLAMETFDGAGQFRTTENGAKLDTSGDVDGKAFQDAAGMAVALRNTEATTNCVVDRLYSYAIGRAAGRPDRAWLDYAHKQFASDNYKFPKLLHTLATSPALYTVKPASGAKSAATSAEKG